MKYLKRLISFAWYFSGLSFIYKTYRALRGAVYCPIITYHSIADDDNKYLNVKTNNFAKQIDHLKKNSNIISIDELCEVLQAKKKPLRNSVVVVFDDGYKDNLILKEMGIPATIFLATDYIGGENYFDYLAGWPKKKMLSWEDVLELKNAGYDFGSHACSHSSLPALSNSALREELKNSKSIIEERTKTTVNGLAYPGGKREDFDDRTISAAKEVGYKYACSTVWGTYNSTSDLYALKRINIDYEDDLLDFKLKLRGWYDWIGFVQNLKFLMKKVSFFNYSIFVST